MHHIKEVYFLMVKVTGIEGVLIHADGYTELLKAVKNESDNYDGFSPKVKFLSESEAVVFHDAIMEEEAAEEEPWRERYCCECGEYDWGRGCPYRSGRVTLMMDACHHFTVDIRED